MPPSLQNRTRARLAIVGPGRLGNALAHALRASDARTAAEGTGPLEVVGPLARGASAAGCDAVLLCVPDAEIVDAAAHVEPGPLVGHCSGACGLGVLASHEAFALHPLMTVTAQGADFRGAMAAIDGNTQRALEFARALALSLAMDPIGVAEADRGAYHAAASIASNFLVTLEAAAEQLGASVGLERRMLVPLVRATVENWATVGAQRALTGPVARGDEATIERQRSAVAERAPELLGLFDALTEATRTLAAQPLVATPAAVGRA
jgi:predicted short-subunit dehydrogenase-like oxidoreductase (DUF2520 family)